MDNELITIDEYTYKYRCYIISGNDNIRYVCIAPYGAYSFTSYATVKEAMAAIDADIVAVVNRN